MAVSLLDTFERARSSGDLSVMREVLQRAKFSEPEIESILWSKGDLGSDPVKARSSDWLVGCAGQSLICALLVGLTSAYVAGKFSGTFSDRRYEQQNARANLMSDYRSPYEAYYKPFIVGFVIGALFPLGYHILGGANDKSA